MNRNDSLKELLQKNKKYRWMRISIVVIAAFVVIWSLLGRGGEHEASEETPIFVTIEIRCDELSENMDALTDEAVKEYIPENGIIISKTDYQIRPDKTTVFDITDQVCKDNDIQIEYTYTPGYGGYYVNGINYIYEFMAGQKSGWLFMIDGITPNYGADKMVLQGGETITWYYTVDYTKEK